MEHQQYEYRVKYETYLPNLDGSVYADTLNLAGEEGWKLVSVNGPVATTHGPECWVYFLIRQIP